MIYMKAKIVELRYTDELVYICKGHNLVDELSQRPIARF